MLIQPVTPLDLPHIEKLRDERHTLLRQSNPQANVPNYPLERYIRAETAAFVVAQKQEKLIGYGLGWVTYTPYGTLDESCALIGEIVLDMHRYHSGLARALTAALRAEFNGREVRQTWVIVPRYHAVEQAFWRSLGAEKVYASPIIDPPSLEIPMIHWMKLA